MNTDITFCTATDCTATRDECERHWEAIPDAGKRQLEADPKPLSMENFSGRCALYKLKKMEAKK